MNMTLPPKSAAGSSLWKYRLVVGAAAVLAVLALALNIIKWSTPPPADVVTTVNASVPTYPEDQVTAAKKDACDAVDRTNGPMTDVHNVLWKTARGSAEEPGALAEFQRVTLIEVEYLESRVRPETPESVRTAIKEYTAAILAELDAVVRDVPADKTVTDVKAAGARVSKVCE
ncbi:membrane protein [Mycobacteroides abscessus]|uniref:hypothetical protein n=2 Tax=Mycobacteroides abscessus TaxID=36809 RepID=UPI0002DE9EF0|nr:hypothetical protein [Mycobacteroides abscessus]CPT80519.1 membrane protein [Mycobacteroides abscessus]CPU62902.1 membrane protein [Mycobacteroides abscessus]SKK67080.1 membrane protein [Mycobacteroides abscessus subsp. massiliense]SKV94965.1 membrane protein [Mycobacteroides abscessus subsp. massiliense]SKX00110.1 Uncharacterised protein [Mycobacteroides abscessus subsp. massiliense]